ncbi:TetR/AcrR family transcriptional regulator [Crassaminicella profunda]|uniref:TetR/AcrR family transcriptional regulator n=1 Tax=Crassaminicella profunda TaxID=1286698 RepID=UPI001CA6720B|nr:TetR/AcrR family transcriptional regulator [Crassaminicella profunda]QZY55838.1 TetR/AcrR family transcriptional regulator [Crassaminicella profunda]
MIDDGNPTKQKIMETSLQLFSKNGYSATSVRQISREAGFRESVIYNHFAGKYDILKNLYFIEIKSVRKIFLKDIDMKWMKEDPKKFLMVIADKIMIYSNDEDRAKFLKIIMMEMFRDHQAKELIQKDVFENGKIMLEHIFLKMMKVGLIKEKNPLILANEFLGPLIFFNLDHLLSNFSDKNRESRDDLIKSHIDFFWENVKID